MHIKLGEQKDPFHISVWCVQLLLVQRYPLQPNVFSTLSIDSSYSYVEGSESSSSFSQRRFAHSATWYIQHVTKACEQTLLDRNTSITILSDEMLPDIPSNFTTLVPYFIFSSLIIVARLPQLLRGVSDLPGALLRRQNHAENRGYPSRNRRNPRRRGRFERTNRGNRGTQVEEDRQHATVRVKTADIRRILNKFFAAEILASLQSEEFVKLDTLLGLTRSETYPIAVVEYCSIVDRSREWVGFGRESTATAWPFQFCRSLIGWIRCRTGFPAILTSSRIRGVFWR